MRKLMWFTIGFTAASAAGMYLVSGTWLLLLAGFCLAAVIACCFLSSKTARIIRIIFLGCTVSFCWLWGYDALYVANARMQDGQSVNACITVTDYSYETGYGVAADGSVELSGKTYKVRVYTQDAEELAPGDQLNATFTLRFTADGGEQEPTYHSGKGILLLAYQRDDLVRSTASQKENGRYFAANLRKAILQLLDSAFAEDTRGFARALLLGDSSLLSYEIDTAFKVSGIRHIIAVSGLHVSILFSLVYTLVGKRRWMTALLGLPVLFLFAAVAGFTPSIVRACIMQALMILALLLNQEYDPPTALAFAVLTMLICNPMTITAVGFQLSVGCMIGIFLFAEKIRTYLLDDRRLGPAKGKGIKARLCRWISGSVSITLSTMVVTTPLCAVYFGTVSLVSILTNLLTLWIVSFIFYGIMAACILALFWLPAAKTVAWVISWLIRFVIWVAKTLSMIPFAAVYTCSVYVVIWLVAAYVLLTVFMLSKKKHPGLLTVGIVMLLCFCLLFSWLEPRLDEYRVSVLDVGQGQCILLQQGAQCYMVDCGGDSPQIAADAAAQQLLSQGISKLDGLILTHYDLDHAAGAELLLSRISADKLYLPDVVDDSGIKESLSQLCSDKIQWLPTDTVTKLEAADIALFSANEGKTGNESSICVLFQPGNCDILITGDRDAAAERALLEQTQLPRLELLIAGHHGSKNATCLELLHTTTPKAVAISVGRDNIHGHPAQEVLDRLALFDCSVWRTDQQGTIIFRG